MPLPLESQLWKCWMESDVKEGNRSGEHESSKEKVVGPIVSAISMNRWLYDINSRKNVVYIVARLAGSSSMVKEMDNGSESERFNHWMIPDSMSASMFFFRRGKVDVQCIPEPR